MEMIICLRSLTILAKSHLTIRERAPLKGCPRDRLREYLPGRQNHPNLHRVGLGEGPRAHDCTGRSNPKWAQTHLGFKI